MCSNGMDWEKEYVCCVIVGDCVYITKKKENHEKNKYSDIIISKQKKRNNYNDKIIENIQKNKEKRNLSTWLIC